VLWQIYHRYGLIGMSDFYRALDVSRNASQAEIQRAYRRLARAYHPDVNPDPGAEQRFKEISEAYDVLSDPDARTRYDACGADFRQVPPDAAQRTWARARPRAGAGAGRRAGPAGAWFDYGGDQVDLEDLLGGVFSGRGWARPGWEPVPGMDQEAELVLSVEDSYRGGWRRITYNGRSLEITIPAGVTDGQCIRFAGQGGRGSAGAPAGDLYLVVRLAPHPRYGVDGRDLSVDLPLAPWEAALGASVAVDTPGGAAKVRVPAGTPSGRRLRLRGRGLPNPSGRPGDLYAEARIVVPERLSDEERRLLEQLAAASTFDPRTPTRPPGPD
jgi:curved DNA-binding protein